MKWKGSHKALRTSQQTIRDRDDRESGWINSSSIHLIIYREMVTAPTGVTLARHGSSHHRLIPISQVDPSFRGALQIIAECCRLSFSGPGAMMFPEDLRFELIAV